MRRVAISLALVLSTLASGCGIIGGVPPERSMLAFAVASDLYVGAPVRVGAALVFGGGLFVSYGSVVFRFAYAGSSSAPLDEPEPGPEVVAPFRAFAGAEDTDPDPDPRPNYGQPWNPRGVYEAEGVSFDRAGTWTLEVSAEMPDGERIAMTAITVADRPSLPAPGQPAPAAQNPTLPSDAGALSDEELAAIDSRAEEEGAIPDPALHATSIDAALADGRPMLILFASPANCTRRECTPFLEYVEQIAGRWAGDAAFIHVELWEDFEGRALNDAARTWLYRDGSITEPWLYLVDGDGMIVDRWSTLFDPAALEAELAEVDPAGA